MLMTLAVAIGGYLLIVGALYAFQRHLIFFNPEYGRERYFRTNRRLLQDARWSVVARVVPEAAGGHANDPVFSWQCREYWFTD